MLDTSAVLAYAATSLAVGETIAEVVDEDARFALPVVCLAEAARLVPDDQAAGAELLVQHPAAALTSVGHTDWRVLAEWTKILGRVDADSAIMEAVDRTGYVLTGEPDTYGEKDELPIVPI